jgi:hypothetical protein
MSEASHSVSHLTPGPHRTGTSVAKVGAALGIAGSIIGIGLFLLACFGFSAAFRLSPIPMLLGSGGLVLTIIGGFQRNPGLEDPQIVASYLINIAVISGALLEMAVWQGWTFFAGGAMSP